MDAQSCTAQLTVSIPLSLVNGQEPMSPCSPAARSVRAPCAAHIPTDPPGETQFARLAQHSTKGGRKLRAHNSVTCAPTPVERIYPFFLLLDSNERRVR